MEIALTSSPAMEKLMAVTSSTRGYEQSDRAGNGAIFIIGMPRSGTKLLRQLLNQHTQIRIPEIETEFFPLLHRFIESHGACEDYVTFLKMFDRMKDLPFFTYMREEFRPIDPDSWYSSCEHFDAEGLFLGLLKSATNTRADSEVRVGDKSPSYINQLPLLRDSFPEAHFVHIVRDPRDYCLSINRAWGKNMVRAAFRWSSSIENLLQMKRDLGLYELRYEDLCVDPHDELQKLCDFLGLEFEPAMTVPAKPVENLGDARGSLEVMPSNTGKHNRLMPAKTRLRIEQLACREMRSYGYALDWNGEPRSIGLISRLMLQLLDGVNLIRHEKNKRGLIGSVLFYWNYFRATRAI